MDKYIEYFLMPKGTWLRVTNIIENDKPRDAVHVIEKSVADELAEALMQYLCDYSNEPKHETRAMARKALTKYRGENNE